jgi:uncharacterized protein YbjT (DUF2867 family)
MNIILGATGQIGSMVVDNLVKENQPVRCVVRNSKKAQELINKGLEVAIADYFDVDSLKKAFYGGSTVFLLTPENPGCINFIEESRTIINNCREAILASGISRVIGLSSMGAQHEEGTGNLVASYLLEHAFTDLAIEQSYVRPAYYFSNWVGYLEMVQEYGILPTFFPPEMKLSMIAPSDVAEFLSKCIISKTQLERVYEIIGQPSYSSEEIAAIFEEVLNRKVSCEQVLSKDWEDTLLQAGFSKDGAQNLMLMTKAVIDGKTIAVTANQIRCSIDFRSYLTSIIQS